MPILFFDYQLPIIACFFLFFAMIGYWISLSIPKNNFLFGLSKIFVTISNLLFMFTLAIRWITQGYFPLSNLYESLIFLSWGISIIHLIIETKTKSRLIGSISTPLMFFLCGFSSLTLPTEMQKALPLVPSLQSNWLMMHVSMMMISYATLILGSLLSILYLAFLFFNSSISSSFSQEEDSNQNEDAIKSNENLEKIRNRKEKEGEFSLEKNYGIVFNSDFPNFNKIEIKSAERSSPLLVRPSLSTSPSIYENSSKNSLLETVDIWSYRIIGLGFPFLTIGIISGAVWANEAWGSYWSWDPKETWAFITWLVFAIYLHSRLLKGWQGKKAAILGSCGFFVIWICYLGVNFLGKGLHSYGWVL